MLPVHASADTDGGWGLELQSVQLGIGDMRRCLKMIFLGMALSTGIASTSSAASSASQSDSHACRLVAPVALTAEPARWLGECANGDAEGLGVIRAGSAEPYQFFLGEMHAGAPVRGMLKEADGWEMAAQFDSAAGVVSPRSWEPEAAHATYLLAARAARATAARFSSVGNPGSSAYYERLAQDILDGEPE